MVLVEAGEDEVSQSESIFVFVFLDTKTAFSLPFCLCLGLDFEFGVVLEMENKFLMLARPKFLLRKVKKGSEGGRRGSNIYFLCYASPLGIVLEWRRGLVGGANIL